MLVLSSDVIYTIINIVILVALLRIFLWKPVLGIIEKRQKAIQDDLDSAARTNEEAQAVKEKVYREALKDANLSETGIDKAVKYANWDSIEVDDKGALKEAKKHIKEAQEEWAAYVVNKRTEGAGVNNPPGGQGGSGKPEVSAAAQLAKAYYADRYGATKED